jgi:hypothetical protein
LIRGEISPTGRLIVDHRVIRHAFPAIARSATVSPLVPVSPTNSTRLARDARDDGGRFRASRRSANRQFNASTNLSRRGASIAHVDADQAAVNELADVLFALPTEGLTTAAVTVCLTRRIVRWATDRGWLVRTEARVNVPGPAHTGDRLGYIDVLVLRRSAGRNLAIEIDSTDKDWSLAKLRHAAVAGMRAVWVRWGDDVWAGAFDDVDVIQLTTTRSPQRKRTPADQLQLW